MSTGLYVRYRDRQSFEPRAFGPMPWDHPAIIEGWDCVACGDPLAEADMITLIPIGPGSDQEAREKAEDGRWFNAVCVAVHAACAGVSDTIESYEEQR